MNDIRRYLDILREGIATEPDPRKQAQARRRLSDPKFRAWFGDSKVVDQDGLPLMCYHGTDTPIESFKAEGSGERGVMLGRGIYVATNPTDADQYAGQAGGHLIPLYVKATNLCREHEVLSALHDPRGLNLFAVALNEIDPPPADYDEDESGDYFDFDPENPSHRKATGIAVRRYCRMRGYDGVSGTQQIMVFDPAQVKPAYIAEGRSLRHLDILTETADHPGVMFHNTARGNRADILRDGLLKSKSHNADANDPLLGGIFFYTKKRPPSDRHIDVWQVDVRGLHLEPDHEMPNDEEYDGDSWWVDYEDAVISPDRLRLLTR